MSYDLRYDGPDMEAETRGGSGPGDDDLLRRPRAQRRRQAAGQARPKRRPRGTQPSGRVGTPQPGQLGALADEGLAQRWAATAAHPDHADANEARGADGGRAGPPRPRDDARLPLLAQRAGLPPGQAMRAGVGRAQRPTASRCGSR